MNVRARIRAWSDPWGYVVIYLGWAWAFWTVVIASGESVWAFPNVVLFYIGSISPALAGVVMVARTAGRSGLRELWDRIRSPRRIRLRWSVTTNHQHIPVCTTHVCHDYPPPEG